ncbi:testis-specific serine/threonine-protein kinase 1-like [Protopterus annectens]|uniref:testis-specific serine/threonine-protein kinase 1-like n=1 Tax=Protopterus annectens TaxID=7888 RepID=UPI001CF96937|nr:testis-specific serine/threonine-protein kinase 1-like [Protopterus annectens]
MNNAKVLKIHGYAMGITLGEGTYSKVKSAYSKQLKEDVAVKIIDRKKAPSDFLKNFLPRELEILTAVNHNNIVKTYEIFESSNGKIYIIMELAVQGSLLEYIQSRDALPEDMARKMFHQLTMAIKYCHDINIVHRDLKCENLLLDINYNIKVSDFGFSRRCAFDGEGHTLLSETFCGSIAYAAPEVLQGIPYQPKMYDIWSLGIVLFIMVCGCMPYDDSNFRRMLRAQKARVLNFPRSKFVTTECKHLILKILHPDVLKRLTIEEILIHPWMQPKKHENADDGKKHGECSQTVQRQNEQPKVDSRSDTSNESKSQKKIESKTEAASESIHLKPDAKTESNLDS